MQIFAENSRFLKTGHCFPLDYPLGIQLSLQPSSNKSSTIAQDSFRATYIDKKYQVSRAVINYPEP